MLSTGPSSQQPLLPAFTVTSSSSVANPFPARLPPSLSPHLQNKEALPPPPSSLHTSAPPGTTSSADDDDSTERNQSSNITCTSNDKQNKWIWVLDPLTRKLRVPLHLLVPTQATAVSGTVPSLCMGFLEGRCRHQWCRQAHVLPHAIAQLRHDALHAPTCCKAHLDPHDISPLTRQYTHIRIVHIAHSHGGHSHNSSSGKSNPPQVRSLSPQQSKRDDGGVELEEEQVPDLAELIPTNRVANTVGLLRYLVHMAPSKCAGASSQMNNNSSSSNNPQHCPPSITDAFAGDTVEVDTDKKETNTNTKIRVLELPSKCVCRLHLSHRCRYLEDCNNIHICRDYEDRIPPPPNILSVLLHINSHTKEVMLNDTLYEVTPIALGHIDEEDFKSIMEIHREEFLEKRHSARNSNMNHHHHPVTNSPTSGKSPSTLVVPPSALFPLRSSTSAEAKGLGEEDMGGLEGMLAGMFTMPPQPNPLPSYTTAGTGLLSNSKNSSFSGEVPEEGASRAPYGVTVLASKTGVVQLAESGHSELSSSHSSYSPLMNPSSSAAANQSSHPGSSTNGPSFRVHDLLSKHYAHCTNALAQQQQQQQHSTNNNSSSHVQSSRSGLSHANSCSLNGTPSLSPTTNHGRHPASGGGASHLTPVLGHSSAAHLRGSASQLYCTANHSHRYSKTSHSSGATQQRGGGAASEYAFRVHSDPSHSSSSFRHTSGSNSNSNHKPGGGGGPGRTPLTSQNHSTVSPRPTLNAPPIPHSNHPSKAILSENGVAAGSSSSGGNNNHASAADFTSSRYSWSSSNPGVARTGPPPPPPSSGAVGPPPGSASSSTTTLGSSSHQTSPAAHPTPFSVASQPFVPHQNRVKANQCSTAALRNGLSTTGQPLQDSGSGIPRYHAAGKWSGGAVGSFTEYLPPPGLPGSSSPMHRIPPFHTAGMNSGLTFSTQTPSEPSAVGYPLPPTSGSGAFHTGISHSNTASALLLDDDMTNLELGDGANMFD